MVEQTSAISLSHPIIACLTKEQKITPIFPEGCRKRKKLELLKFFHTNFQCTTVVLFQPIITTPLFLFFFPKYPILNETDHNSNVKTKKKGTEKNFSKVGVFRIHNLCESCLLASVFPTQRAKKKVDSNFLPLPSHGLASGRWVSPLSFGTAGCWLILLSSFADAEWKTLIIVYEYCMIFSADYWRLA